MIVHEEYNDSIVEGELLLLHTIWNTTNDNMFIVRRNENGEFINEKTNPALKKIFGFGEEQIDGISLKNLLDEDTYLEVCQKYNNCIKENKPLSYEEVHDFNDCGEQFWNTTILPVVDKQNNIIRIFGISREITELKKLNETLEHEVEKRTKQLQEALIKIKKISITDKLTGLYNRHYLDSLLENTQHIINRYGTNYGLILIDIDNFKNINDNYGHNIGDTVLKEFSLLLKKFTRETDIVGRWGGEEFLIIVPFASEESILTLSNHIREGIERYSFSSIKNVTASFGASLIKKKDNVISFISRADKALYKAKGEGKNRVEILN